MSDRISKLEDNIKELGLDAYIVASPQNIRYYTGSMGGSFLIVTPDKDPLLLATLLDENVTRDQSKNCNVETYTSASLLNKLADTLRSSHTASVGFDEISFSLLKRLTRRLPEITFNQNQDLVWAQRSVKDSKELKLMREAGRLANVAMEAIFKVLAVGEKEHRLAAEASYSMMREGAEAHAFEFTIGSGTRSAYPHASSTNKKIERGDLIVVDIGALFSGYCSDITRTFIAGKPEAKKAEIYELVLQSYNSTFASMKPGVYCRDVDAVSRKSISEAGYGRNYTHSVGHGVGMEVHEPPSVSQDSKEKLVDGNVVSDEPGIYIHGFGGVRIEDTVLISKSGPRRLTDFPRDLEAVTF